MSERREALKKIGKLNGSRVEFGGGVWFDLSKDAFCHRGLTGPQANDALNRIEDQVDAHLGIAASAVGTEPMPKSCHYCGMPAVGFGPFDEPACEECGG